MSRRQRKALAEYFKKKKELADALIDKEDAEKEEIYKERN